jgi:hypothetical protein
MLSEYGYPTNEVSQDRTVPATTQRDYLQAAWNLIKASYPYVDGLCFYHFLDWGPRDTDREHWFGCIEYQDGSPKPFKAVAPTLS